MVIYDQINKEKFSFVMNNKEKSDFCLFFDFYVSVMSCRETFTLKTEVFLPMGKPLISNFTLTIFFLYKICTYMDGTSDPQSLRLLG